MTKLEKPGLNSLDSAISTYSDGTEHPTRPDPDEEAFVDYASALRLARHLRDDSEWFTDHPYKENDDAPFDSAIVNNTDNDEEVLVQVMSKTDFAIKMQRHMQDLYGRK